MNGEEFMIRIVSDSSSLYSVKEGQANGVIIAPLSVNINGKSYKEHEDIETKEFIDIINEGHIPTSSQPSIGEVMNIYDRYPEDEIINISMADGLSGTYNSACMARDEQENAERITVINSKTLCGPQKYLVDLAVALAKEGKSKSEIVVEVEKAMENTKSFLIPKDFDYLVRGGRLSPLVGKIGGIIKLVPVMSLAEDGRSLTKFTTKRTLKKAIQKICEVMSEDNVNSDWKIYITHACDEALAESVKNIIMENIEGADIEQSILGPVFTTQGGPGCIAIQYIKKHEILK